MKFYGIKLKEADLCLENTAYLVVSRTDPITRRPVLVDAVKVVNLDNKKSPATVSGAGQVAGYQIKEV